MSVRKFLGDLEEFTAPSWSWPLWRLALSVVLVLGVVGARLVLGADADSRPLTTTAVTSTSTWTPDDVKEILIPLGTFLVGIIGAIFAGFALLRAGSAARQATAAAVTSATTATKIEAQATIIGELEKNTNSMKDALVAVTGKEAHLRGLEEGRAEGTPLGTTGPVLLPSKMDHADAMIALAMQQAKQVLAIAEKKAQEVLDEAAKIAALKIETQKGAQ